MESFLSLGSIMAFRSDRFQADRTFFEILSDEELANLALKMGGAAFLFLVRVVSCVLALKYRRHVILKLLFPSANLGRGNVILLGDLQDALLALERLGGDTGFELGGQVSFFVLSV